ncbi:6-phospho-beta-glucosidase [Pullulanibacillus camelliae]|uniref:6-phospho-beta-glucosidase n=1 Tax=Pullulanibacillus camelliae TaxID=1707096 RepID=A0A8J2YME7_9BACL|nr:6-phospho-beta-glucosidase [Pullulanibacillus camelliae]GGE52483.1 6-phospho-beta-glucosidase [Pullulanibacillus camelliae]
MSKMKLTIIGAGSGYSPEILEGLASHKATLPVEEIMLMDINPERLEIMYHFSKRYAAFHGLDVTINRTTDLEEAVKNKEIILTQIRVGGNQARVNDEKIPLKYGIIGQETTGPGGFMKALRTLPAMLKIAKAVEKHSPNAWIINYTNPTGIVAEAVNKYTKAKFIGLCAGGMRPRTWVEQALGIPYQQVKYDFIGLNHMNFAYNIKVNGRALTDEEFDKVAEVHATIDPALIKKLRMLPSQYCQYYFHKQRKYNELKKQEQTRGETILELEAEIFKAFSREDQVEKPELLKKRGGGGYSEIALQAIHSIYNDQDMWIVANVQNRGTLSFLPNDATIETACLLNKSGIKPLQIDDIPDTVRGLISSVKNYESLTVEAAVSENRDRALLALLAHPFIGDYDLAQPLLNELLEANKAWLGSGFYQTQRV